mmetsp:Transcript_16919/g.27167  ORF Transcript_16919/g.27167 Transcript_16919/m.27167 type:complete len:266 (-) Transcript_16919:213-1010(-)
MRIGEVDREMYRMEKFADAHLTPKGWDQCYSLKKHLGAAKVHDDKASLVDRLELVVVSPLMRALETAVGCLGGDGLADASPTSAVPPLMLATEAVDEVRPGHAAVGPYMGAVRAPLAFVACELCREHIGKNPCDRRRPTSEYRAMFPGVDFSCITEEEDVLWGTMNESNEMMCERSHRFMEWIMRRPEQHIAVVTHSAFMAAMLREFGATDQLGCTAEVKEEMHRWPNNCEMRPVVVVDPSGGGGMEPMFFPGGDEGITWAAEAE